MRMRDKIVGELTPRVPTGSFNMGLFTGVILGAAITLLGASYMNSAITENTLHHTGAITTAAKIITMKDAPAVSDETTPARMKTIQYTDRPDLTLPPPFEAQPSQTAGNEYSI